MFRINRTCVFVWQNIKFRPYNALLCRCCFIGRCKGRFKRYIQYAPVTLTLLNCHWLHGSTLAIWCRLQKWANLPGWSVFAGNGGAAHKGFRFAKKTIIRNIDIFMRTSITKQIPCRSRNPSIYANRYIVSNGCLRCLVNPTPKKGAWRLLQ